MIWLYTFFKYVEFVSLLSSHRNIKYCFFIETFEGHLVSLGIYWEDIALPPQPPPKNKSEYWLIEFTQEQKYTLWKDTLNWGLYTSCSTCISLFEISLAATFFPLKMIWVRGFRYKTLRYSCVIRWKWESHSVCITQAHPCRHNQECVNSRESQTKQWESFTTTAANVRRVQPFCTLLHLVGEEKVESTAVCNRAATMYSLWGWTESLWCSALLKSHGPSGLSSTPGLESVASGSPFCRSQSQSPSCRPSPCRLTGTRAVVSYVAVVSSLLDVENPPVMLKKIWREWMDFSTYFYRLGTLYILAEHWTEHNTNAGSVSWPT